MSEERMEAGHTATGRPVERLVGRGQVFQGDEFLGEIEYDVYFTEPGPEDPKDRPLITGMLSAPLFWSEPYSGTLTLVFGEGCFDFVFGRKDTNEIFGTSGVYVPPARLRNRARQTRRAS